MPSDGRALSKRPYPRLELLVGRPDENVLGVDETNPGEPLRIHVETRRRLHVETRRRRPRCEGCGGEARVKDRPAVELVDLPFFGRPARLVWRNHHWECPEASCSIGLWTGEGSSHRLFTAGVDGSGRTVGHRPSGPVWPYRQRGRHRAELSLAYRQRHGDRLGHRSGRRRPAPDR